jgi:hypothetical protein
MRYAGTESVCGMEIEMIKKIVMFTKGIETLWFFSEQMGKTFELLGYDVFYFDQCTEYRSLSDLIWFCEPGVTAAISFNFDGCSGEEYFIDAEGISFFDARDVLFINIVVDHPFYYHKFEPLLPKQYVQFSIDRDHEAYLKRFFPEIVSGGFLPLAGTEYTAKPMVNVVSANGKEYKKDYGIDWIPYRERKMDIIFTGNYTTTSKLRPYLKEMNEEYEEFYFRIVDDFLEHPHMKMDEGIEKHLWEEVEEINEAGIKECMPNMIFIDLYVRFYFRAKAVRALVDAGFRVDVFGGGWEYLEC